MAERKIDRKLFREMWMENMRLADMAQRFGVSVNTVSTLARSMDLPPKRQLRQAVSRATERKPAAPANVAGAEDEPRPTSPLSPRPDFPECRDLALIEADGRYTRIADLAAEWNLPMRNVLARWHRLRVAMKTTTKTPAVRKATA